MVSLSIGRYVAVVLHVDSPLNEQGYFVVHISRKRLTTDSVNIRIEFHVLSHDMYHTCK